jgi:hypothetical protein
MAFRRPAALLLGMAAAGCVPTYRMPSLAQPHASLSVRFVFHSHPGPVRGETVLINGERVERHATPLANDQATVREIPVLPAPTRLSVMASFSHQDTTMLPTNTSTIQMVPCGTTQVGDATMPMFCPQFVPDTTLMPVTTSTVDAACSQELPLQPQIGAVYLLQYDFAADGSCTLSCARQWPQPDGSFRSAPC